MGALSREHPLGASSEENLLCIYPKEYLYSASKIQKLRKHKTSNSKPAVSESSIENESLDKEEEGPILSSALLPKHDSKPGKSCASKLKNSKNSSRIAFATFQNIDL